MNEKIEGLPKPNSEENTKQEEPRQIHDIQDDEDGKN